MGSIPGMRLLAALSLALASTAAAQARPAAGTIDALVTDTTLAPLEGAAIAFIGSTVRAVTGDNGRLQIRSVPEGRHHLSIQRLGYRPLFAVVDIAAGDTARLSFALVNANPVLDRITVTASGRSLRMAEFDERRANATGGQFMTGAEIEKRNSVYLTEIVRTFRGIAVKPETNSNGITDHYAVAGRADAFTVGNRLGKPPLNGCPVEVYVDNIRMPTPYNLDNLPPPSTIAGIEYYTGPSTTPPQYGGMDRRCGVMLVWTKDGR